MKKNQKGKKNQRIVKESSIVCDATLCKSSNNEYNNIDAQQNTLAGNMEDNNMAVQPIQSGANLALAESNPQKGEVINVSAKRSQDFVKLWLDSLTREELLYYRQRLVEIINSKSSISSR